MCLDSDVKRSGRFVGNQHFGLAEQGHRDHHALAHATGEFVRVHAKAPCSFGNLDGVECLHRARASRCARHAFVKFQHLRHLAFDRQIGVERSHRVLKNHGHAVAANPVQRGCRQGQQVLPVKQRLTRGRAIDGQQAHHGQHGLALAGTAFTDDAQSLPTAQRKADVVDGGQHAIGRLKLNAQFVYVNQSHLSLFPDITAGQRRGEWWQDQAGGALGSAAVPRPAASSFMPLR